MAKALLPRKTKIVCTLGPSTASMKMIRAALKAGADVIRLNFSHGNHKSHAESIAAVRGVADELGRCVPIIQDLQGPRFRVGVLPGHEMSLKRGMKVRVVNRPARGGRHSGLSSI